MSKFRKILYNIEENIDQSEERFVNILKNNGEKIKSKVRRFRDDNDKFTTKLVYKNKSLIDKYKKKWR